MSRDARPGLIVPANILVVDDDLMTRAGLCELLEREGYVCTSAGSFTEAKAILRASAPDLLITDIRLGAFNGLQLVIQQGGRIPSIVITGFDDALLEATAQLQRAIYLVKPIRPTELLAHVRTALNAPEPRPLGPRGSATTGIVARGESFPPLTQS